MNYLALILTSLLIPTASFADSMKREGDISRDMPIQYATVKFDDCGNPMNGLLKQVKIINGESRIPTKNDPSGGFLVGNGNLAGRGSLVGFGNIVVSVAHGILELEDGGIDKDIRSVDGKVYFHPSNDPRDRVEIDLENSKFGCRASYKDPLPAHILNLPTGTNEERNIRDGKINECDWAILKLKENLISDREHKGKGYVALDWMYNINRDILKDEMRKGNVTLITADPKNAGRLFEEKKCPEPVSRTSERYSNIVVNHGCDSANGDSGSGFILDYGGHRSFAGMVTGFVKGQDSNTMTTFSNEFFYTFKTLAMKEKEERVRLASLQKNYL